MKNILIVYYSRMGHTARMVRTIADQLEELGNTVTVMPVSEALREGVDWSKHDFVLCGSWSEVLMSATSLNIFISSGRLKNFANRVLAR